MTQLRQHDTLHHALLTPDLHEIYHLFVNNLALRWFGQHEIMSVKHRYNVLEWYDAHHRLKIELQLNSKYSALNFLQQHRRSVSVDFYALSYCLALMVCNTN